MQDDSSNCGVTNPLSNLGSISQMGALAADARGFQQLEMPAGPMGGQMMESLQPGLANETFGPGFEEGPALRIHMPQAPQMVHPMEPLQNAPDFFEDPFQHAPLEPLGGDKEMERQFQQMAMRDPDLEGLFDMPQQGHQFFGGARPGFMDPMMGAMMGGPMMMNPMMAQPSMMAPVMRPQLDAPVVESKEPVAQPPMNMGLGMDKAMIDKLLTSDDPKWRNSKFLKFISQIQKGEIEFKDNQVVYKTPEQISAPPDAAEVTPAAEQTQSAEQVGEDWAAEFDVSQASAELDHDVEGMQDWMSRFTEGKGGFSDWARAATMPKRDPEYVYAPENPFMDAAVDPYTIGIALLKEGKLKEAIKAFEAATQKTPNNAEAWRYLGQAQAENEDEKSAIAALLKCISLDPYNLPALLMLGVSYTNDLAESRALNYLKTWMVNNPDYEGTEVMEHVREIEEYASMYGSGTENMDEFLHQQVTKMFLKAAEINPKDADVFTVLGVLYHISSDFDKAIAAFRKAVELNPTDPTLWNKLGATQANSSKSDEAVHAYKNALQLRPTYVRALANLAIAFANQGLHEDAVRTYLATLKQNPSADHIWSYLRVSLATIGRGDLVKLAEGRDVEPFREHFRF